MKRKLTLLVALIVAFASGIAQQVPNGSFENWSDPYTATGWTGIEDLLQDLIPFQTSYFTFKDTTTFTAGLASIKVMADTVPGAPTLGVLPGVASLGTGALVGTSPQFTGIPFIFRPDSVLFDYFYTSPGVDSGGASLSLIYLGNSIVQVPGRSALQTKLAPDSNWVHFAIALAPFYVNNIYPDSLLIQFVASTQNNAVQNSTLHIDNLRFGYVNPPISVTTSGSTTFCSGDSVALHVHTDNVPGYSYQWNLAGTPISGATASTYYAKGTGAYTVTIVNETVSATSIAIAVADTNCVSGINNLNTAQFSIFPNPVNNILSIQADQNMSGFTLDIFDLMGRKVASQVLTAANNTCYVANLANGAYLCRITDKQNNIVIQSKVEIVK